MAQGVFKRGALHGVKIPSFITSSPSVGILRRVEERRSLSYTTTSPFPYPGAAEKGSYRGASPL